MAVYVGPMLEMVPDRLTCREQKYGNNWSHLTADAEEELHFFAWKLGLRYEYAKKDVEGAYYLLTPAKRAEALSKGAREGRANAAQ